MELYHDVEVGSLNHYNWRSLFDSPGAPELICVLSTGTVQKAVLRADHGKAGAV